MYLIGEERDSGAQDTINVQALYHADPVILDGGRVLNGQFHVMGMRANQIHQLGPDLVMGFAVDAGKVWVLHDRGERDGRLGVPWRGPACKQHFHVDLHLPRLEFQVALEDADAWVD